MTLPNFLVLGAARCATTSLHYYLDQHPDVAMSMTKEPNFFAFDQSVRPPRPLIDPASPIVVKSVSDRVSYERLFPSTGAARAVGEASPLYLYVEESPAQIHRLVPDARLVAIVRHPVDRAYSHWLHINRDLEATAVSAFAASCAEEMAGGYGYSPYAGAGNVLRMGLYDVQLRRYLETFGRDRLLVLAYEPFVADPASGLARICDHLGVAPFEFETGVSYNPSGVTRGRIHRATTRVARSTRPALKRWLPAATVGRLARWRAARDQPAKAPSIPDDLRDQLNGWFARSVAALRVMDVVDVSHWDGFDQQEPAELARR